MHQVNHAIPAVVAQILRNAPTSPGKIDCAWKVAVGPATARMTDVRLEGTVLLVDARSLAWTREVRRASPTILLRLQSLLGPETITEVRVRA